MAESDDKRNVLIDDVIKWVGLLKTIAVGVFSVSIFVLTQYYSLSARLTVVEKQNEYIREQLKEIKDDVRAIRNNQN